MKKLMVTEVQELLEQSDTQDANWAQTAARKLAHAGLLNDDWDNIDETSCPCGEQHALVAAALSTKSGALVFTDRAGDKLHVDLEPADVALLQDLFTSQTRP